VAIIQPSLLREFLTHVINEREHYRYNVRSKSPIVIYARHFVGFLRMKGYPTDDSKIYFSALALFYTYVERELVRLRDDGLIRDFHICRVSKHRIAVFIFLDDEAYVPAMPHTAERHGEVKPCNNE